MDILNLKISARRAIIVASVNTVFAFHFATLVSFMLRSCCVHDESEACVFRNAMGYSSRPGHLKGSAGSGTMWAVYVLVKNERCPENLSDWWEEEPAQKQAHTGIEHLILEVEIKMTRWMTNFGPADFPGFTWCCSGNPF